MKTKEELIKEIQETLPLRFIAKNKEEHDKFLADNPSETFIIIRKFDFQSH